MNLDIRKATLDAIVEDGEIVGFKADGYDNRRMDGYGIHIRVTETHISPTGEDAPDVFKVIEHHYYELHRGTDETSEEYIVLGEENAVQKAYQIALENATRSLEYRNSHIKSTQEWRDITTIRGEATLVDNAKDKIAK